MDGVTLQFTFRTVSSAFTDDARIARAVDRARMRAQRPAAAWIRVAARRSIRRRKGYSRPGRTPHSHTGLLKRGIYFAWDRATRTTVIGPVRAPGAEGHGRVPEALEHGGTIYQKRRRRDRRTGRVTVRRYRAHYQPRPYMRPALRKAIQRGILPRGWRDAIRGRTL